MPPELIKPYRKAISVRAVDFPNGQMNQLAIQLFDGFQHWAISLFEQAT